MTAVEVTLENVPQVAPLQPAPDTVQFTPPLRKSFCTVAVKFCEPLPVPTDAVVGETETEIGGGGLPAADLKAAIAAPHGLKAPRVAVAEAGPIVVCSWSSVTSLVLGSAGTKS